MPICRCLIDIIATELKKYTSKDLLVVSREPSAHAHLFKKKDRLVIQDFFLATPKHPFLKWLLDDRLEYLNKKCLTGNDEQNWCVGPFSYSIEKDIDRYRALDMKKLAKEKDLSSLIDMEYFVSAGAIFELPGQIDFIIPVLHHI